MHSRGFGRQRWRAILVAAAVIGGAVGLAHAGQPTREELEERVRRLEQIIRDAGLDQPAKAKAAGKARAATTVAAPPAQPAPDKEEVEAIVDEKLKKQKMLAGWKDGFFLESPGGDFKLKLRGYAQADARFFPLETGDTGTDQFYLRRVRPIFEGTVYKYFDFRIMPDFGNGQSVLQDAYARVNYWPYAQLMAGKFKSPVSLERLQSGAELTFIERSIANNLAPNREVGVTLGGSFLADTVSYQAGVMNGSYDGGSNDGDVTSDKDFEGRAFVEPFKSSDASDLAFLKGFGIGIGGSYGGAKKESASGLKYQTAGRSTFFKLDQSSTVLPFLEGQRYRWAPSAYYYYGPFGFMGEYIASTSDIQQKTKKKGGALFKDGTMDNTGWFLQASWVLTGEDASYRQVKPINNFDPRNGRWGAFEVAGRVSGVDIGNDVFDAGLASHGTPGTAGASTSGAMAYTGGLNWYLNTNFKLQLNWEHTQFDQKVKFGHNGRNAEDVFISRFQIAY